MAVVTDCTGWFVLNLGGNPENQFPCDVSHDLLVVEFVYYHLTGKHVHAMNTPLNPTFIYSKTGVCRGIPIFLIFAPKHRLIVGTQNRLGEAVLTCTHNLCFEQK